MTKATKTVIIRSAIGVAVMLVIAAITGGFRVENRVATVEKQIPVIVEDLDENEQAIHDIQTTVQQTAVDVAFIRGKMESNTP